MPRLTRWFLRTALGYLVLAMVAALLLAVPGLVPAGPRSGLAPVYFHLLMVGWVTQMIFGVAVWMFPRVPPARSFGNPVLGWGGYLALNGGLLARAVGEPVAASGGAALAATLLLPSAVLQLAAVVMLTANLWPRIRSA